MKVITISNQKGGTAKTTTAAALAVLLSRRDMRVHLIDMDPQASLTRAFGREDRTDRLYNAFTCRAGLPVDAIAPNLTLTPSTVELSKAETELLGEPGREYFLRVALQNTELPENAMVIIDSPPSLGLLTVNCLSVAGGILPVIQPGGFELHALVHLHMTVRIIQERIHPELAVLGAIITNAHLRRSITSQVYEEVSRWQPVLGVVRSDARMLYATSAGKVLTLTRSKALSDYDQVADRLWETVL